MKKDLKLKDEKASLELGAEFAKHCYGGCVIYLQGELGAGKTTFVRGFLQALGYAGKIKSPTYTLVEPYESGLHYKIFHFDLYRLERPEELDFMGVREYFVPGAICLIEWPERALNVLGSPDVCLQWVVINEGRQVIAESFSTIGDEILKKVFSF